MGDSNWMEAATLPAILRRARGIYANAMRRALEEAGYGDIPKNGLYVIGGLALDGRDTSLAKLIGKLGVSKQSAGQLIDTLVLRGYVDRTIDPDDRRRMCVGLSERGQDAAKVQASVRDAIDQALKRRVGKAGAMQLRKLLAALIGVGLHPEGETGPPPLRFIASVPILFVRDIAAAAEHYRDKLGFTVDFLYGDPLHYGGLSRDRARIHLRQIAKPNFALLAERETALVLINVEVSDVADYFDECLAAGVEIVEPLTEQPWGGTDFVVRDPDGNQISFVEFQE